MFKSKTKQIAELKYKNGKLEQEKDRIESELRKARGDIEQLRHILNLVDTTPEDCERGEYCRGCGNVIEYVIGFYTYYTCGRGGSCKHFKHKED